MGVFFIVLLQYKIMPLATFTKGVIVMRKITLFYFCILFTLNTNGQDFSANKLLDMLSLTVPEIEKQLVKKKYRFFTTDFLGDTAVTLYQYYPPKSKKKKPSVRLSNSNGDSVCRKFKVTVLNETFKNTYQTTSAAEYTSIIGALKQEGFYCEYDKGNSIAPPAYLYQHGEYTAEALLIIAADTTWYSITFYEKRLPINYIHFAEDLLQFTSHEYLVYFFGANNVKKDAYYFGADNVVKCSVLFINTKLQVIFIWRDELNRRKIGNLLFGGSHKLKSLGDNEGLITENDWLLKSGIHSGMPLADLRRLNEKNIAFCGGDAPNPGLIFPESTNKVDFKNADIVLGCTNCSDDKFMRTKIMNADKAMSDGRELFIHTIILYPVVSKVFD
jgi:hypothetical protein